MKLLSLGELKSNMKIGKTIYDSHGNIIVEKGVRLSLEVIEILKKYDVEKLYIEEDNSDEDSFKIKDIIADASKKNALKEMHNSIKRDGVEIEIQKIYKVVEKIIADATSAENLLVGFSDIRTADEMTFMHSINVCSLSIVTGITLGLKSTELMSLGVGALLHDIGITKISRELLTSNKPFSEEERREMEKHTIYGYDLLREQGFAEDIAVIALQHHERYNGTGYPNKYKEKEINLLASIVGVAEVYDALVHDRNHRRRYLPHEAIEYLLGSGNYYFDYDVVKAFVENIAVYPIGTRVKLSTGEVGHVTFVAREYPGRPHVLTTAHKLIKLDENPTILIMEVQS